MQSVVIRSTRVLEAESRKGVTRNAPGLASSDKVESAVIMSTADEDMNSSFAAGQRDQQNSQGEKEKKRRAFRA